MEVKNWLVVCLLICWTLISAGDTAIHSDKTLSDVHGESTSAENTDQRLRGRYISEQSDSEKAVSSDAVGPSKDRAEARPLVGEKAKRILIMDCLMDGSHTHIQRLMARELASRGHNVTWLTVESLMYWPTERDRELMHFRVIKTSVTEETQKNFLEFWTRKALSGELSSFSWYIKMWLGWIEEYAKPLLANIRIAAREMLFNPDYDELRAANFDMVLCEVMFPMCASVAHDILKVPFINTINGGFQGTRYSRWYHQPSPLSYVPEFLTSLTDTMTFPQRVSNFLTHLASLIIYDYVLFIQLDKFRAEYGLDVSTGTRELMSRAELNLYNWDFVLGFPRPIQPNSIMIGGLTTTKPKLLSKDIEEFVQGSCEHGVVIFSVSTLLNVMDLDMANMIGGALARLPQRVIWKYVGEEKPTALGNNTLAIPWISQQDLLAHEKTRLLIYHGGLNGGFEAMYYGVPILGIPMFSDQIDIMVRLKNRVGMAQYFPDGMRGLTMEKLYQGIQKVLSNPLYRENAQKASRQLRDVEAMEQGLPLNRTARWIEYAIEHGTAHLRTGADNMAWYQLIFLDVMGVYVVVIAALVYLMRRCWYTHSIRSPALGALK